MAKLKNLGIDVTGLNEFKNLIKEKAKLIEWLESQVKKCDSSKCSDQKSKADAYDFVLDKIKEFEGGDDDSI